VAWREGETSTRLDDDSGKGRLLVRRKNWLPATHRGAILCNGWSVRAHHALTDGPTRGLVTECALEGMTVVSHDLTISGNADGWGNADVVTQIAALKTWLQGAGATQGGAAAGKIVLIGISMGAIAALNYALSLATPSASIAGIALLNPMIDPADMAADPDTHALLTTSLYAAFGGSSGTYAVQGPAHNPNLKRAAIGEMGIPIRVWISTNDDTAESAIAVDFATKVRGVSLVEVGAYGHLIDSHPMRDIAVWLRDLA
jgi:alpha-beta hydrolase superfamily lysophospholipase